jgi:hypothetical protein
LRCGSTQINPIGGLQPRKESGTMDVDIHNVNKVYVRNREYGKGSGKFHTLEIEVTTTDGKSETITLFRRGDSKINMIEWKDVVNV